MNLEGGTVLLEVDDDRSSFRYGVGTNLALWGTNFDLPDRLKGCSGYVRRQFRAPGDILCPNAIALVRRREALTTPRRTPKLRPFPSEPNHAQRSGQEAQVAGWQGHE